MSEYNPRIDAYIDKAAPFAQPILNHLRELVHKACPNIEEKIKWSMPHFDYMGRSLFGMAGFKQHCAFGFWLGSILNDPKGILQTDERQAMGSLGRITSLKDLPSDKILLQYMKESAQLAEAGIKVPRASAAKKEPVVVEVPDYFMAALKKNKKALAVFEKFAPSHRKEYIEWITEAKREETREKRIAQALEWMAEGKSRHWKYQ